MEGILEKLSNRKIGSFGDPDDYVNKTDYSLAFWESVFTSDRIKSLIENDTLFGELNHPKAEFRSRDIDLSKVSHRVKNIEFRDRVGSLLAKIDVRGNWNNSDVVVDKDTIIGDIYADVDILDTPLGKILHTYYLCKANIGFSSRADGDTIRKNGKRIIKDYSMLGIDAVLYPSKRDSRIIDESEESVGLNPIDECVKIIDAMDEEEKNIVERFVAESDNDMYDEIFDRAFGDDTIAIKRSEFRKLEKNYKELTSEKLKPLHSIEDMRKKISFVLNHFINKYREADDSLERYKFLSMGNNHNSDEGNNQEECDEQVTDKRIIELEEENLEVYRQLDSCETELAELKSKYDRLSESHVSMVKYFLVNTYPRITNDVSRVVSDYIIDSPVDVGAQEIIRKCSEIMYGTPNIGFVNSGKVPTVEEYESTKRLKSILTKKY